MEWTWTTFFGCWVVGVALGMATRGKRILDPIRQYDEPLERVIDFVGWSFLAAQLGWWSADLFEVWNGAVSIVDEVTITNVILSIVLAWLAVLIPPVWWDPWPPRNLVVEPARHLVDVDEDL